MPNIAEKFPRDSDQFPKKDLRHFEYLLEVIQTSQRKAVNTDYHVLEVAGKRHICSVLIEI